MTTSDAGEGSSNNLAKFFEKVVKFLSSLRPGMMSVDPTPKSIQMTKEVTPAILDTGVKHAKSDLSPVVICLVEAFVEAFLDALAEHIRETIVKPVVHAFVCGLAAVAGGLTVSLGFSLHSVFRDGEIERLLVELAGINEQIEEHFELAAGDLHAIRQRVIPLYTILYRKLTQIDDKLNVGFRLAICLQARNHFVWEMFGILNQIQAHIKNGKVEDEVVEQLKTIVNLIKNKIRA